MASKSEAFYITERDAEKCGSIEERELQNRARALTGILQFKAKLYSQAMTTFQGLTSDEDEMKDACAYTRDEVILFFVLTAVKESL